MLSGNIYRRLMGAAVPLLIGDILQQLYNITDTIIIGRFLGSHAFAAAGISSTVMNLFTFIIAGFCTGISIIFDNKFAVGDIVEINGFSGTVIQLGLRTTKIKSFTGEIKSIGNSSFNEVINYSLSDAVLYIKLNVAYDTNLEKLEKVLSDIREDVLNIDGVITYELNGVDAFADSSIVYMVSVTCKAPNRYSAKRAFLRLVKDTFDKEKIEIPYTTVDINVRK